MRRDRQSARRWIDDGIAYLEAREILGPLLYLRGLQATVELRQATGARRRRPRGGCWRSRAGGGSPACTRWPPWRVCLSGAARPTRRRASCGTCGRSRRRAAAAPRRAGRDRPRRARGADRRVGSCGAAAAQHPHSGETAGRGPGGRRDRLLVVPRGDLDARELGEADPEDPYALRGRGTGAPPRRGGSSWSTPSNGRPPSPMPTTRRRCSPP